MAADLSRNPRNLLMADLELNGKEISIDLEKLSIKEFRQLRDPNRPDEEGDAILGKVTGLTAEEVGDLSYPDFRRLVKKFYEKALEAGSEKN